MSNPRQNYNKPARQVKPAQPPIDLPKYIAGIEPEFKAALSDQKVVWAQELVFALQAIEKNDNLREAAEADPTSLRNAIINVAAVGVSLNPVDRHAYLVPRKGKVCLDISYKGLIAIGQESGAILWVQAKEVCQNDEYIPPMAGDRPHHVYEAFNPEARGEVIGCYCVAKTPDGSYLVEELDGPTLKQIEGLAGDYPGSAWKLWKSEMRKKAAIKRGSKSWGRNNRRMAQAAAVLNEHEGNDESIVIERDVTPTESETLNMLLEHDDSPMVDGQTIEEWILNAETREDFARTRQMLREMAPSPTKVRLQTLWMYTRDEMAKFHNARPETATSDETTS